MHNYTMEEQNEEIIELNYKVHPTGYGINRYKSGSVVTLNIDQGIVLHKVKGYEANSCQSEDSSPNAKFIAYHNDGRLPNFLEYQAQDLWTKYILLYRFGIIKKHTEATGKLPLDCIQSNTKFLTPAILYLACLDDKSQRTILRKLPETMYLELTKQMAENLEKYTKKNDRQREFLEKYKNHSHATLDDVIEAIAICHPSKINE